ncbi:MAG: hypothetical protein WAV46_04100 [Candidatus Moraniibacteriota bacterium]
MNFENPTPATEKESHIPSLEEIKVQIERLSKQEKLEVIRTLEDEKGVYLHEVVTVDDKGDTSLFSYRRSGDYQETKTKNTLVDVAYFVGPVKDDMCVGGDTLSNYDENSGEWVDAK